MSSISEVENGLKTPNTNEEKKKFLNYIFFFSGQQISILGSSVVSFALIWWITVTTQSELMLGIASLASLGPALLTLPFSGVIADRANKKNLLIIVDSLQAIFTVILAIIFLFYFDPNSTNNYNFLLICIFVTLGLRGVMQAFHSPTVGSLLPIMIPEKHLSRMNGVNFLLNGIISVTGPVLGAIFLPIFGVNLILWVDVITFAIGVIPLLIIKIPSVRKTTSLEKKSFLGEFSEGIGVLRNIKGMFALIFIATLANFFLTPVSTLMPLFINKTHGGIETDYALVVSLLEAGIIVGGLFMSIFKGFKNKIRTAIFIVLFMNVCQMVLVFVPTFITGRFWIIGSILFIMLLANPAANVSLQTVLMILIPKDKMGRAFSVLSALAMAITPLGNFLSGVIGEYIPIGILFTASAICGFIIILLLYFLTPVKNLDVVIKRTIEEQKDKEAEELEKEQALLETIKVIDEEFKEEKKGIISLEPLGTDESVNPSESSK